MSALISSVTRNDGQANIFVHSTDVAEKDGILKAGDEVQPCFEKRTDFKAFSVLLVLQLLTRALHNKFRKREKPK